MYTARFSSYLKFFSLLFSLLLPISPIQAADQARGLAASYRHWLEEDVPYIIATDERKAFLALHTDIERDNFIEAFWEARNPTPGEPYNAYKEEHYRRLAFANDHFGSARYQDGWRTDMGRVYITLGPPKFITPYHLTANVRDMEIWFFQGLSPTLPPSYNILFFRPGAGEDYRIYSPRNDGPYRLVTTGQQDNSAGLKIIRQQLGPEVAHIAQSLIPSEPVDSGQVSMSSDLMLTTIRNLADSPIERERLHRSREMIVSSVIVPSATAELESITYRDARNRLTLSYLLRDPISATHLLAKRKDGSAGYSLLLRSSLFTSSNRLLYSQQNPIVGTLSVAQANAAAVRHFGVEDRLPILPGTYNLEVSLRNNLTSEATIVRKTLIVAEPPTGQFSLSALEVYTPASPVADPSNALPFSVAGLRFAPRSVSNATIHAGEKLPLVFQLRLPLPSSDHLRPKSVHIHYVFGAVTASGGRIPAEADEELPTEGADIAGNILTGHLLDTADLSPGSYRVVVQASGAVGSPPVSSTLQLHIVPTTARSDLWTVYGRPPSPALDDFNRGLIAAGNEDWEQSATLYGASLLQFPTDAATLRNLAAALAHLSRTPQLAALASQPQFAKSVDPGTVLLIANALDLNGAPARAISLVEGQLRMQAPTPALLNGLASFYDHTGDRIRARESREQANALVAHP